MRGHDLVAKLESVANGVYDLTLFDDRQIRVFICECYSYGVAEFHETVDNIGKISAIVINYQWCGYSSDAKLLCRGSNVGLFTISEFMAALNRQDFWNYLTTK